ncbi:MAG: hypothetical protein DRI61_09520 [Chloroflexi bacterium]|nr:MAG: hypothetical protein DRI61_09520 [Chloroflexota bacterium]
MTERELFEKNLELQAIFLEYVLKHPDILDQFPQDFQLVILPEDDPELSQRNLELLRTHSNGNKPVVVVKLKSSRPLKIESLTFQVEEVTPA